MRVLPLSGTDRGVCEGCGQEPGRIALRFGRPSTIILGDRCVDELRCALPRRRGRRPLSAKARRVLAWIAQTPAEHASLAAIGAATGGYAYNVVHTLCERALIEPHGGDCDSYRGATFSLTAAGAAELAP